MQPYLDGGDARVSTPKEEEEKEGKKGGFVARAGKGCSCCIDRGILDTMAGVYIYTRGLTRLQVRST
jgi:hypothetical protein